MELDKGGTYPLRYLLLLYHVKYVSYLTAMVSVKSLFLICLNLLVCYLKQRVISFIAQILQYTLSVLSKQDT